jgi:dTDP-4-dehydrorhamnose reductase
VSKSILITGAGGQVGHELAIADCPYRLIALSRQQLDITDPVKMDAVFSEHQPDIVINAAAYTQVDRAEQEQELAYAINRDGVANLAKASKNVGIPLLHISTDYVFDGSKSGVYVEDDPVAPLGVYGESKAAGETVLRETLDEHIILRTSWVFSATGNNFVKTMLRLGNERDEIAVVNDQFGCPTSARSIAEVLLQLADMCLQGQEVCWGTYHFCNGPDTTWFNFAKAIFEQVRGYENLKLTAITTNEYPTPVRRPKNSVLGCLKLEDQGYVSCGAWRDELNKVLVSLKASATGNSDKSD